MTVNKIFSIIPYKGQLIRLENALSAKAFYRHYYIDLLTGMKTPYDFYEWIKTLEQKKLNSFESTPRIIHLFYELGFFIEKEFQLLNHETLLAVDLFYETFNEVELENAKAIHLNIKSFPQLKEYKHAFELGYAELLKGNCYQFNLTFPFIYSFEKDYSPQDFISSLWKKKENRGAFGSATFIPYFNKLFLSNSPECLFQLRGNVLSSMPIKGTLLRNAGESWKPLYNKLIKDKKSQAELFMISDLLRNDLSKIDLPKAVIVKKKFPKLVPGLVHQCSQIEVELGEDVSLWRVIENIFPGGSITGAPKLRAMRLINQLEKRERHFYCGSTIILREHMKSASINIRSGVIDFNFSELIYQAGGGITLLSKLEEEYKEMTYKHNSFIRCLTL